MGSFTERRYSSWEGIYSDVTKPTKMKNAEFLRRNRVKVLTHNRERQ